MVASAKKRSGQFRKQFPSPNPVNGLFMSFSALIINPWVADFKLYDEWMHPIGLYYLATLLQRNGAEINFINCLERPPSQPGKPNGTGNFASRQFPKPALYRNILRRYKLFGLSEDDLAGRLKRNIRPDVVFVGSAMTYWLPGLAETVRVIKHTLPECPIVIGGISAQLIPQAVAKACPGAFVYGGTLFDQTALRKSGIPYLSSLPALTANDSLIPGLSLLTHANHGPALASLGCPLRCSYCASHTLHPNFVRRPPSIVVDELLYMRNRFRVNNFAWYDDALLCNSEAEFIPLTDSIAAAGVKNASFHSPNGLHVRWISSSVLNAMKRIGFRTLRFGYEAGSSRFLRDTRGKTSRDELASKIELAMDEGFCGREMGVYVMAGLEDQTPVHVEEEIAFVASLSVYVKPVFLSPVPGTIVFDAYAQAFPDLLTSPLTHNDTFFVTRLPGWDAQSIQRIMDLSKAQNAEIS